MIGAHSFDYFIINSITYDLTVTCIIQPDSTADRCEVMAMDDGGVTKEGKHVVQIFTDLWLLDTCVHMYMHTYKYDSTYTLQHKAL